MGFKPYLKDQLASFSALTLLIWSYDQGRLHKVGEWCEMHHGENWGGNVVMIMMLLLVSIIIYYYMNTFITLHQCTFNLLFALFFYAVSQKNIPIVSAITRESIVAFLQYLAEITEKVGNQKMLYFSTSPN